jgi:hypothetical protein
MKEDTSTALREELGSLSCPSRPYAKSRPLLGIGPVGPRTPDSGRAILVPITGPPRTSTFFHGTQAKAHITTLREAISLACGCPRVSLAARFNDCAQRVPSLA